MARAESASVLQAMGGRSGSITSRRVSRPRCARMRRPSRGELMRRLVIALLLFAAPGFAAETPYHLTLGGPAPRVTTEKELRAFLDELEGQQFMSYEALSLEEYYQWKGYEPTFVTPFTRFANDLSNRPDYAAIV